MDSQIEAVRQDIRSVKDKTVEIEQELAIAKQAGNKGGEEEVRFLRGRLEKLDSQVLSLNEKENILLHGQASVMQGSMRSTTRVPLYSFFLVDAFSMRAPYEQYGLYLASLTGGAFMANSFFKAFNLAKYVKYSQQQGYEKEAQYAADMAQVHPHELERAGRTVAKLRARGVATALAFPALWIAWRLASHTPKKST